MPAPSLTMVAAGAANRKPAARVCWCRGAPQPSIGRARRHIGERHRRHPVRRHGATLRSVAVERAARLADGYLPPAGIPLYFDRYLNAVERLGLDPPRR